MIQPQSSGAKKTPEGKESCQTLLTGVERSKPGLFWGTKSMLEEERGISERLKVQSALPYVQLRK